MQCGPTRGLLSTQHLTFCEAGARSRLGNQITVFRSLSLGEELNQPFYPPAKGKVFLFFINGVADLLVHMKHVLSI